MADEISRETILELQRVVDEHLNRFMKLVKVSREYTEKLGDSQTEDMFVETRNKLLALEDELRNSLINKK